jgi:hypothetical protein
VIGLLASLGVTGMAGVAHADNPPPAGNVIYQLTGQTISGSYQLGQVDFIAGSDETNLAFAFREDPAYIHLSDVSMIDLTTPSANLVVNGNFDGSTYTTGSSGPEPDGWSYLNIYDAGAAGVVANGCGYSGDNCYDDGSVGSYDAINQVIATTIGDTYQVSFYYLDTDPGDVYEPTGDGRDMFVYAGAAAPTAAPEPAALAVLCGALGALGVVRRRKTA